MVEIPRPQCYHNYYSAILLDNVSKEMFFSNQTISDYLVHSLNIPDLRPNVGLFWYFFTEMFEHFRMLFVCAFQLNASLLYVAPLSLRLYREPLLLATSLTALAAIFRSYPSVGDVGFYLALLPMWKHLFHCEYIYSYHLVK